MPSLEENIRSAKRLCEKLAGCPQEQARCEQLLLRLIALSGHDLNDFGSAFKAGAFDLFLSATLSTPLTALGIVAFDARLKSARMWMWADTHAYCAVRPFA